MSADASAANLVEIFSSVQGEGPDVGRSTLFVRFGECDLRCRWCDSPHTWQPARECRVETTRGSGSFRQVPNPVSVTTTVAALRALELESHAAVSLTGGEPLLQPEAAAALARALHDAGPPLMLETHGLAVDALERVLPYLDVVSMDWKLASDVRRASDPRRGAVADFHDAHAAFLERARSAPRLVVKLVITPASDDAELDEALRRIAALAPQACVVLQPVTPSGPVDARPSPERMLALSAWAGERLGDVRVIPQTHPVYGVR